MRKNPLLTVIVGFILLAATFTIGVGYSLSVPSGPSTTTPIKHLVVIYQEGASFDHYFASYPYAVNPPREPNFTASLLTPTVNNLGSSLGGGVLYWGNPNAVDPFRLDYIQAFQCANIDNYKAEQQAYDAGQADQFVQALGRIYGQCNPAEPMGYFDGNTVTAVWEYAQHFAMSDNFFATTFGSSTPESLNLIAATTDGGSPLNMANTIVNGTVIGNAYPAFDDCSLFPLISVTGTNIGNLLNDKGITWGWFQGGFTPSSRGGNGAPSCLTAHTNYLGLAVTDYNAMLDPFQYFNDTSNKLHLPPTSTVMIGQTDQANHQYDLSDFWLAANSGNMPSVSFLKAPGAQTGQSGSSDPLDEQTFLVNTINAIEKLPSWSSTMIVVTWDGSGGWYDHVVPPKSTPSNDPANDYFCGHPTSLEMVYADRCGYGSRVPLLIISPWAKSNFVDGTLGDYTSILSFIENNWGLGRFGGNAVDWRAGTLMSMLNFNQSPVPALYLSNKTGLPT